MNKRKIRNPRVVAKAQREPGPAPGLDEQIAPLSPEKLAELEQRLAGSHTAQLVEANEQLVFAMLRTQLKTESAERELKEALRSAEIDALTGLPNRVLFFDRFSHAIVNAKRRRERLALLFLDLNNFKQINDTLGHATGDEVLKLVSQCFLSSVREADTVSRLGGDEFLILLTEISQPADAALIAKKVIAALGVPHRVGEHELRLSTSIGISLYPDDGEDAEQLVERADTAMYRAKRHGLGGYLFHGEEPSQEPSHKPQTFASLKRLVTHYELLQAERDRQHGQLQEANEQLLLAALTTLRLKTTAEQAQRQQQVALAVMAQELSPIRMMAKLLGRVRPEEVSPRLQSIIERLVAHLSRLLDNLLDISRSGNLKLRLERQLVNLADIITNAVEFCRPAMLARVQHFSVQLPAGALTVDGDPARLEQILYKLLDNACRYTQEGGEIKLVVALDADGIAMSLSDNGIGIDAAALEQIFQAHAAHAPAIDCNVSGRLIGLDLVRELVVAHGGEITASSAGIGLGSQFMVKLPLAGGSGMVKG